MLQTGWLLKGAIGKRLKTTAGKKKKNKKTLRISTMRVVHGQHYQTGSRPRGKKKKKNFGVVRKGN